MERDDVELHHLSVQTQANHRSIRASNKLSACLANVQHQVYQLTLLCETRWTGLCGMFTSHVRAEEDIRKVAKEFPDKIDDSTVTSGFMKKAKHHVSYLTTIKATHCDLQATAATLSECVDYLEILDEEVQEGHDVDGHYFEHCELKDTKYGLRNRYDSGKLTLI